MTSFVVQGHISYILTIVRGATATCKRVKSDHHIQMGLDQCLTNQNKLHFWHIYSRA